MEITKKRKMLEVLRGLIGSGFEGNQSEICEYLKSKGYEVTQSTVSRALKKIGAQKVSSKDNVRYEIRSGNSKPSYFGSLQDLMNKIECNESQIVIKTKAGSAMFLAGFIDHYCTEDSLGTVAGDDTIFIAPRSIKTIRKNMKNIESFIKDYS